MEKHVSACMSICPAVSPTVTMDVTSFIFYMTIAYVDIWWLSIGSSCLAVDITAYHRGFHGDLNETLFVGEVDDASKELVRTTYECLKMAIDEGTGTVSFE